MTYYRNIFGLLFLLFTVRASAQIGFMENKGQWDTEVTYQADFNSHSIYLDQGGFSILLHDEKKWNEIVTDFHDNRMHNHSARMDNLSLDFQHIKYELRGANLSKHRGTAKTPEYYNFFLGSDTSKWAGNVKKYTKVMYYDIYPHIDLEFETIDERFKYNFILNPGANIEDIKIDIVGDDGVRVTSERIYVKTKFGEFSEVMPISYEQDGDNRKQIKMSYVKRGDYIGFETPFFKTKVKTVIDPEVIFSTYSGSSVDNFGFTATYDESGNLYAGGIATSPTKFAGSYPATPGAYNVTYNGGTGNEPATLPCDISISKYNSSGSSLLYATYLGGSSDEYPHSLIVDRNNQLIVFGSSYSLNYPTTAGAPSSFNNGGMDIIVTKFNTAGSALVGSTYIGGSSNDGINANAATKYFYADDFRGEVNLDEYNNIYVATSTISNNFPTTSGAVQSNLAGFQDGVVFCLNPTITTLKWSTYLGGTNNDAIYSIDIASNRDIVVAGGTASTDIPKVTEGYNDAFNGGRSDGFISRLSFDGTSVIQSTYLGTSRYDQILLAELDKQGNVYIVGHSEGNMPLRGSVYSNTNGKQFISKLSSDLKSLELSTVYGSGKSAPDITVNAFLVDDCDKVYVSGWGSNDGPSSQWSLGNMPLTSDAFQRTTDGKDFHLIVFEDNLAALKFATYYGGSRTGDHVDGGTSRFDKKGIVYHSVCSSCPNNSLSSRISDFPTTAGAFSENNPSPRCSNASFKMAVVAINLPPEMDKSTFSTIVVDTVELQIGDTFDFSYTVIDPEGDSLYVDFDIPSDLNKELIQYKSHYAGIGRIDAFFSMVFSCKNAGKTYTIKVHSWDIGCPFSSDSFTTITVIVDTPPTLPPPEVLCLNFVNESTLRIDWTSTMESGFYRKMYLYRTDPKGNKKLILETGSQLAGSYTDTDVIRPRERNYTYYLEVENICGTIGVKSYDLSSVKESEVPVLATYLKTVTVSNDSLHVVYLKSKEDDFGHYEIYKGIRGKSDMKYITSVFDINDTIFFDRAVNVNSTSYCYRIRVADKCGHLSTLSNIGCSIVIRGIALNEKAETPRFKFDLDWDDYITWNGGVEDYELIRAVDTGSLRPIVRVNSPTLDYRDANLDYDWGGYWYSVVAYEAEGSLDATSRSNDIYLIQPPLVFVPNAVTANGDGLNDVFGWSDVFVREFEMKLYNRWGEKVFESTDRKDTWSGKYKSGDLSYSNVYFWIVTYKGWDNMMHREIGTVTIVK